MTTALVNYDAARKALAAAARVDEVKSIRDKAVALQVYAKQARDGDLIGHATEIRKRAERRLGELMAEAKKAGELPKNAPGPGRGKKGQKAGSSKNPALSDQGIDKNLANRARKSAAMSEDKFEAHVAHAVNIAKAAAEGDQKVLKAARAEKQAEKRARRHQRERDLGAKQLALPDKKYGVIYADPPWKFEPYSEEIGMDRAAGNHYSTMTTDAIGKLEIPAADDCVCFLWATPAMLKDAFMVLADWGFFEYKSHLIWKKNKTGTGYWARNQHELLLIGTRGNVPAPAQGDQPASVIEAPVGKHSEKPAVFRAMIETMFPSLPRIELFAREKADGWDAWGNEVVEGDCSDRSDRDGTSVITRSTGNDIDVEQSAEERRRENEALASNDDLSIPECLLRKKGAAT